MNLSETSFGSERWSRLQTLFHQAIGLSRAARSAFLDEQCHTDPDLRHQIDALLKSEPHTDKLIDAVQRATVRLGQGNVDIGTRVGAYRITGLLGQGGMGAVYLAERDDQQFVKQVAVKVLTNTLASKEDLHRFLTERQILADLEHPNIARLLDGDTQSDGSPFLVMEYVNGIPIDQYCEQHEYSLSKRLDIFLEVCTAVQYAHEKKIVHRDIKPANILVDGNNRPKLLDFGISKLLVSSPSERTTAVTQRNARPLTPEYASPEQICGRPVTASSDVYSLGVLLYELMTGFRPFQLSQCRPGEIEKIICTVEPKKPSDAVLQKHPEQPVEDSSDDRSIEAKSSHQRASLLKGDLDTLILKAMHKDPTRRYQSVKDLSDDISRYLSGFPVLARADSKLYRGRKFVSRNPVTTALTVALLLLVSISVVGILYITSDSRLYSGAKTPQTTLASIAVLPFSAPKNDPGFSYFGDGLSEEIVSRLSQAPGLFVIARNSTRVYRNSGIDPKKVGKELGVRFVLEGSVHKSGNRVRVNASLVDTTNTQVIWSETFDRELRGVFDLQDELTTLVVDSLAVNLTPEQNKSLSARHTNSIEAFDFFLRGLETYGHRKMEDNHRARSYFQQAVELDKKYARAYATLANTYRADAANGWTSDPEAALEHAEELIQQGLKLDSSIPQIHFVKALIHRSKREHVEALASAEQAITLNPNYADGYMLAASVLCFAGTPKDSVKLIEKAMKLNPRFPTNYPFHLGVCNFTMGKYTKAISEFETALQRNPVSQRTTLWLTASYANAGRVDDAQWRADELLNMNPELTLSRVESMIPYRDPFKMEELLNGLRIAGVPE